MSMIRCPECQSEVSAQAAACPKCGYPLTVETDTVIITPTPPPIIEPPPVVVVRKVVAEKRGFPAWALVPIALALVVVTFGFIWMLNRDNQANNNSNSNLRIATTGNSTVRTTQQTSTTTINPPSSADSTIVVPPPPSNYPNSVLPTTNLPAANSETVVTVPPADKGNLVLTANVLTSRGTAQPVKAEKFYLLSKDLEAILSTAGVESTEGSYASTLGAAIADPNRKDELQKCLAAINPYIVARTLSDAAGKASFKDVKPNNYYLFGVTKVGNSASVWNTSVAINPGENTIALNSSAPAPGASDAADSNY